MKTFLGIDVPENIRNSILALIDANRHSAPEATWTKCPHITLLFLGERPVPEDKLVAVANQYRPIMVSLGGCGTFKNRGGTVVWVGVKEGFGEVYGLMKDLHLSTGIRPYGKDVSPHLTIVKELVISTEEGRAGPRICNTIYKEGPILPQDLKRQLVLTDYGPWIASGITLYESKGGGIYEPIKEYKFNSQ